MTKKKKLNSKNPKYWDKSLLNEKPIKEKKFMGNAKVRNINGNIVPKVTCAIHAVWYE